MNSYITDFDEKWKIIIKNIICNNESVVKDYVLNDNSHTIISG